jgi:UDP-N-acetylmuramoyl-tripeptide--D-alanyl-D-alanine ligase
MPTFAPVDLVSWTGGRWTAQPVSPLSGFTIDSRAVRPGQIFIAIKTEKRDGHDFLAAAHAAGAAAAIVSTPNAALPLPQLVVRDPLVAFQAIAREHRRAFRGQVVGISGSAGKTSTKELLTLVLGGSSSGVLATEGNLNNHLGVPLTLTRLDAAHVFAVIEAGISGPGDMKPLAEMIQPDVGVITMVGPAHIQALGSLDGVAREKSGLVRGVAPHGVAVFPKSCTQFAAFRDLFVDQLVLEKSTVLRPATRPQHTIHYNVIQRREETVIAVAFGPPPPAMFKLRRITDGMADNAALAITVALRLGVKPEVIQLRLAAWSPPKLRGEIRREEGRLLYLDCYNANPASMADALATFTAITDSADRRLYAIGCMEELGDEAAAHHRRLGRALPLRASDRLLVIGTWADEVCRGVLEQGDFSKQIQICSTLDPIAAAIAEWRGAVFVKGSRRYQLEQALAGKTPVPEAVHA